MSRSTPRIAPDKPLGGRYTIISQLGVGGFGRTFLAEDLHLPGHPRCVIKHLKPQTKSDDTLQMARRCFNLEAQVLYHLGSHDQIPRLLAHFEEEQEFYLAQEFIEGEPLTRELAEGKPWSQGQVVTMLKDILQVLKFVHQEQVIHRDLKPSNLIRRRRDGRIVLIDFGAVKQVSTPNFDADSGLTNITISIGTHGYMPNEQLAGRPKFCSDIYAVGVLAIQTLTGIHPRHFNEDKQGEIAWHADAPQISLEFRDVVDRMVRYDFRERYVDAAEVLLALENLPETVNVDGGDHKLAEINSSPETMRLNGADAAAETSVGADTAVQGATASQNTRTMPQIETATHFSGEFAKANLEFSNAKPAPSEEEPVSTAIWMPTESLVPSMTGAGTNMTQAVGRPHLPSDSTAAKLKLTEFSRRLNRPWAIAGLAGIGLLAVLSQTLWTQFHAQQVAPTTNVTGNEIDPALPSDPAERVAALMAKADRLIEAQKYKEAIAVYDQVINLKPDHAEAYAGRCETLNLLNRPEEALVACNDALAYRPNYPEALWSQGNARLLQNRPYDALALYEDVTQQEPSFAPGWVKRGVALQALGRSAEALTALDQGIKLERNSFEAWVTKGEALLNLQRYDAALAAINKALQLDPDSSTALELREIAKGKATKDKITK